MQEKIIIIDFGSQFTQLIGRKVRELNVYSEIHPYHNLPSIDKEVKGIILSGSPYSVLDKNAPNFNLNKLNTDSPILGICFGAHKIAQHHGVEVLSSNKIEYGKTNLRTLDNTNALMQSISNNTQVWMSYKACTSSSAEEIDIIASSDEVDVAAFQIKGQPHFGLQFHPEVFHTTEGLNILKNFVVDICDCHQNWTPNAFTQQTIKTLKEQIGNDKVILGLSGGVDSTVTAALLNQAIGNQLYCIFVDNGLLRKNEFNKVLEQYKSLGLSIKGVDAKEKFMSALQGITDPEKKRKAIGRVFIEVFEEEAHLVKDVKWLGQGTIYPDVIESVSATGSPSSTIKSHHNVGGLPDFMKLKVVEPLRLLFKDEVRRVGESLGLDKNLIWRHPFPGPGLGIRILGEITKEKVQVLQEADHIFIDALRKEGLYDKVWQAGAILLPVQSVGVMDDKRTYERAVALRAVQSVDGMTAEWCHLPYDFLAKVSNAIIHQVKGINRVVYDISSKPPATIEWE